MLFILLAKEGIKMKIIELLEKVTYQCLQGNIETEVEQLVFDSRQVTPNSIYVCIPGTIVDGHKFIPQAIEAGAKVIVVTKEVKVSNDITVILVEDARVALAYMSAVFFHYPANKMKIIGITGTKGKTTTAYMMKSILENAGYRVGLIGTIETIIGKEHYPSKNTTPESYVIQETFSKMVEEGSDFCVMEVSSQGLMMHRTDGIDFEIGIFMNLESDHIGPLEHSSFEDYASAKGRLFKQCKLGIVNQDDEHWKMVLEGHTCRVETFGFDSSSNLYAHDVQLINNSGVLGVKYQVSGDLELELEVDLPGKFSVYNSLAAVAVCHHFEVGKEDIKRALKGAKVKGRIELVKISDQFTVMIDYAHNAMSLESLLSTLKEYGPSRLVSLFGCGGNRSPLRRYEMGEVSGRLAEITIITSDNPRDENPMKIMEDIVVGIEKTKGEYILIEDRKEAIRYAILNARCGDIIVLAGKGHEDYQEIHGIHYPMDERVLIAQILDEEGGLCMQKL